MDESPVAEYDREPRRADASMSLLNHLMTHTLDEDYAAVAARREQPAEPTSRKKSYVGLVAATAVFGLLLAVAAVQTDRSRPAVEEERASLIERINAQSEQVDELRARSTDVDFDVRQLQAEVSQLTARGDELSEQVERLGVSTGAVPVEGPGMVLTVDDGDASAGHQGQVLDSDLRLLVNGLWAAGAEAIGINGQRITGRTAIGSANRAITVNFRSLRGPYVVSAIGDPNTIEARFFETAAGQAWLDLETNFGVRFDTETVDSMQIAARGVGRLRYAADAPEVSQ